MRDYWRVRPLHEDYFFCECFCVFVWSLFAVVISLVHMVPAAAVFLSPLKRLICVPFSCESMIFRWCRTVDPLTFPCIPACLQVYCPLLGAQRRVPLCLALLSQVAPPEGRISMPTVPNLAMGSPQHRESTLYADRSKSLKRSCNGMRWRQWILWHRHIVLKKSC